MSGTTSDTAALPRNIAEFLVRSEIGYRVVAHASLSAPVRGPDDVARLLPIAIDRIAKTLFVVGGIDRTSSALVVVPVRDNVELAVTATAMGWQTAALATRAELSERIGQQPFGVSPLAAPHGVTVLVDVRLASGAPVLVGAGVSGLEVEIDPSDLVRSTGAVVAGFGVDR
jgi:Cys-tRNA(Pro)/Cys-tRNA(Cys) deacylase